MTASTMNPSDTFTVRTPEDALVLAPIMFGFGLDGSVVIEAFGGPRPFQGRTDLPPAAELDPPVAEALADQLVDPAQRIGSRCVVLLFYSDDLRATDRAWRALRRRLARAGIELAMALRAHDGRYHPLRGARRLREVGVAYDVEEHPLMIRARAEGRVPLADRQALASTAAADPSAQRETEAALAAGGHDASPPASGAEQRAAVEWARGLVADHVADATTADTGDLARLAWLLQTRPVAQGVWSLVTRESAGRHAEFWVDLCRRTPEPLVAAPAALLAWSAWQAGHGALAWIGVDRCREVDPEHPLAGLVAIALEGAWPPDALDGPRADWAPSLSE